MIKGTKNRFDRIWPFCIYACIILQDTLLDSNIRKIHSNNIFLGFIGKGMTRHLNRLWNYGAKGLLGTLIILFVFPIVCVLASVSSLVIAFTAILWLVPRVLDLSFVFFE